MTIKNCEITTTTLYGEEHEREDDPFCRGFSGLELRIKVPNGWVSYEIRISNELKASIEKASTLQ